MKNTLLTCVIITVVDSIASAGLVQPIITGLNGIPIDPVSEIAIGPSDMISFDILSDVQLLTLNIVVKVTGPGTLDPWQTIIPPEWERLFGPLTIEHVPGKVYEFGEGNFNGGPPPGIQLEHLLMHCDGPGDVNITVLNGTQGGTDDMNFATPDFVSVIVHQTPEPMSFGLLGLGGLALFRRPKRNQIDFR